MVGCRPTPWRSSRRRELSADGRTLHPASAERVVQATHHGALGSLRVFSPDCRPLAHLSLPERCANLCWGGPKGNRLFMAASNSVDAMHFNVRGAGATP